MKAPFLISIVAASLAVGPVATAAPTNDGFGAAEVLEVSDESALGTNVGATKEPREPAHAGNPGGRSVWFAWTAPADGTYVFVTEMSTFDTLLAVYTGSDVAALTEVASNDDAGVPDRAVRTSEAAFYASEGVTYFIAVDGFGGKQGRIFLRWYEGVANDFFDHPETIDGSVGEIHAWNFDASLEADEPTPSDSQASVWFEWQAPATQLVKFSTLGARFDSVLGVYTGSSVGALTTIATNDDDPIYSCCASSFVGFDAVAGTTYRIAVGGWRAQRGDFTLSWSPLLLGTNGDDTLVGTPGVEEIRGLLGNDVLRGAGGADVIVGGRGNDRSFGGPGNDILVDHHGRDVLSGGSGRDLLDARDRDHRDALEGGPGRDRCHGNRRDVRRSC